MYLKKKKKKKTFGIPLNNKHIKKTKKNTQVDSNTTVLIDVCSHAINNLQHISNSLFECSYITLHTSQGSDCQTSISLRVILSVGEWVTEKVSIGGEIEKNKPYSLMNLRQGTEFLMQVPVRRSTFSTMTKGFSSRVTMVRWLSSVSASPKELKRGHTGYFKVKLWFSHLPICKWIEKRSVTFLLNSLLALFFKLQYCQHINAQNNSDSKNTHTQTHREK